MPRYQFNVYDGTISLDLVGTELADIHAAPREALRMAISAVDDAARRPKIGTEWRVEVTDHAAEPLFRFDLIMPGSRV